MPQLTVRHVPEKVVDNLRREAEESRLSLNRVVQAALEDHVARRQRQREMAKLLPRLDSLRQRIREERGGSLSTDGADLLRADRDR